jgi:hypothetical protein
MRGRRLVCWWMQPTRRDALVADRPPDDVEDGLAIVEPEDGVGCVGVPAMPSTQRFNRRARQRFMLYNTSHTSVHLYIPGKRELVVNDVPGSRSNVPAASTQVDDSIDGEDVEGEARSKPPAVHDCRDRMQSVQKEILDRSQSDMTAQQTASPDGLSAMSQCYVMSWSIARTWDDVEPDTNDGQ